MRTLSWIVTFGLSLLVSHAAAQGGMARIRGARPETPVTEEAAPSREAWRAPHEEGVSAFAEDDFETALARFQRSAELGAPASVTYDIAVCLDRLGRRDEAIASYQRYLELAPDAANRDAVEERIAGLTTPRIASRVRSSEPAPPILTLLPTTPEVADPVVYAATTPTSRTPSPSAAPGPEWIVSWVFLGLTAASAGGAAIAFAVGQSQFDALVAECAAAMGCTDQRIASDPSNGAATAANALWVTTGILGGITLASFVIEGLVSANPPRRTYIERAGLRLEVGAGSLSLHGTF